MALIIWGIPSLIICLVITYIVFKDNYVYDSIIYNLSISMIISIVSLLIFMFIPLTTSTVIYETAERVISKKITKQIVAVRNGQSLEGSFVFGTGSFGTNEEFVCYTKENGVIRQVRLNASKTHIIEGTLKDSANIKYVYYESDPDNFFVKNFCFTTFEKLHHIEIHVPDGTVIQQMKIE